MSVSTRLILNAAIAIVNMAIEDHAGGMAGMNDFGIQLKNRLELRGIDGKTLAARVGVSESMISDFTTGRKKNPPTPEMLAKLSSELGWPESEMLREMGYLTTEGDDVEASPAERALLPVIRSHEWSDAQLRAAAGALRAIAEMGRG